MFGGGGGALYYSLPNIMAQNQNHQDVGSGPQALVAPIYQGDPPEWNSSCQSPRTRPEAEERASAALRASVPARAPDIDGADMVCDPKPIAFNVRGVKSGLQS